MSALDLQSVRPAPFDTEVDIEGDSVVVIDASRTVAAPARTVATPPVARPPAMGSLVACKPALSKDAVITAVDCPSRLLLDQIADKWSVLILAALAAGPHRFNELKRRLAGVTQKALTQSLRRLERNGIVERQVLATSPVAVEYTITPLGQTLKEPFEALYRWTVEYLPAVDEARVRFDGRGERGE